ncbi:MULTISPECIES: MEDS domain-containing protein [Salinibaculum]|uniref:MEDS domain-containing protein n=1 Tax=Salinibaculum TaxID=2732368 RepID=UPI0030D17DF4
MSNTQHTDCDFLSLESGAEALQTSAEFDGPVESLDCHHCGDHFALVYENQKEQLQALVPFLRHGLERGDRCLYIVDDLSRESLLSALRDGGVDVDAALESGQLSFRSVEETYLDTQEFDPDEMVDFYADAITEATEEYSALRVVAETTWLHGEAATMEQFLEYEAKINRLFDNENCIGLCQYDRTAFDPDVIRKVIQTHPHLIYDGTVTNNVYYTPPEEYLGPDDSGRHVERMLGTLRDRTQARMTLQEWQQHQRQLYDITSDPGRDFEEKLQALFDLGCDVFEMDLGAIAQVDPENDLFEITRVSDSHDHFQPGTRLALSETYCSEVIDKETIVSVSNPVEDGVGDTPVRRKFNIQSYVGACLNLDSSSDRTFFFISTEPRDEPFSEAERTFHYLMSQWVESELERQHRERSLRELYEIIADGAYSFEEKMECVLELGCDRFGLDQGYLTRYHPDDDIIENEYVAGPATRESFVGVPEMQAKPGQFCHATVAQDEPIGAPDVRELGWDDDPVYTDGGLTSYFGVRVTDGTGCYGTLAFCDTTPRDRPYTDAEQTFLEVMGQWVSHELEQQRREAQLAALNDMSRELMEAATVAEIADLTAKYATQSLQLPLTAVATYETETGELTAAGQTPRAADTLPLATLYDGPSSPIWEVFVSNEPAVIDASDHGFGSDVTQLIAVPLAQQGAFITATTTPGGFTAIERDFIETTAATVEAACTRADRERQLHEREKTLEEQNTTLERLNRINTTIRNIDQALVQASTREEIEEAVCEQLASVGPYEMAWIGARDSVTDEVTPCEAAGAEKGYLDEITVTVDETPTGKGPSGKAVRTHEAQVVNNILDDPSFEPWRRPALSRGYHACIALPLVYEGTLYGLLVIYAGQPGVFDELEQAVLAELGQTIAYAINAIESKKALISDELTELEFAMDEMGLGIVNLVQKTGCEFSLETLVPRSDGGLRAFFSTRGARAAEIVEAGGELAMTDLRVVSECTEGDAPVCMFEAKLESGSLAETVLDHGGLLRQLDATESDATVTIDLATDAEVREFVEAFQERYSNATLVAQRTRERPERTSKGFRSAALENLTARQLEVLQTAYFNGYFEEPRTQTASEIAEILDISQPTFTSHTRRAQRKIFQYFFEEGPAEQ